MFIIAYQIIQPLKSASDFDRTRFGVFRCVFCLHNDKLCYPLGYVNSFYFSQSVVEVKLMDAQCGTPSAPIELPIEKAKNGRPSPYSEETGAKIIEAVRGGLTLERAAEYVGLNPSTVQGWTERRADFGRLIKKARREHELSLLRSVEAAGEKSWQARAWCLERIFQYAQPSARLNVTQDVTHGLSSNLASLLAGIAGRKKITASPEKRQIESSHNYIDIQPVATKPENHLSNNKYCINKTNSVEQQQDTQDWKRLKLR